MVKSAFRKGGLLGALILVATLAPAAAHAQTFSFGTAGVGLAAEVRFSVVNNQLCVELTNLGAAATNNAEVLVGVVWTDGAGNTYSPFSISASSLINNNGTPFGGDPADLGKNWQAAVPGAHAASFSWGLSATGGSGAFGPSGNFALPGSNLGGVDWGIVNGVSGFGGNQEPFANNKVTFKLDLGMGTVPNITGVSFGYGSAFELARGNPGPAPHVIPEPASTLLLLGGAPAFALLRRRRRGLTG